jgi:hypothetical protein
MSPVFDYNDIKRLYRKLLELLCLHEGMFPITENKIIWHQIIDLPLHIPKCGMIKNWWAISGERSLHSIKQYLPTGGLNNEATVMSRYTEVEDERTKEAYRTPTKDLSKLQSQLHDERCIKNINGIINYSNTTFKLFNVINFNILKRMMKTNVIHNDFEVDELLKVIIVEILKKTTSKQDALNKSPTFRVYNEYVIYKKNKKKSELFFYDFVKNSFGIKKEQFDDFETVKKLIIYLHNPYQIYKRAIVYGVKMQGRGFEYKEDEFNAGITQYTDKTGNLRYGVSTIFRTKNVLNSIQNCWHHGKSLSSWCSFRNYLILNKIEIDNKINETNKELYDYDVSKKFFTTEYGQFNYIFRINTDIEGLLNGIPLSSVTVRNIDLNLKNNYYINKVDLSTDDLIESFNQKICFVSLTDVYSTKFLVGLYDNNNRPFVRSAPSTDPKKTRDKISKICLDDTDSEIETTIVQNKNETTTAFKLSETSAALKKNKNKIGTRISTRVIENKKKAVDKKNIKQYATNEKLNHIILVDLYPYKNKVMYNLKDYEILCKRNHDKDNDTN